MKECKFCDKEFESKNKRKLFCSSRCSDNSNYRTKRGYLLKKYAGMKKRHNKKGYKDKIISKESFFDFIEDNKEQFDLLFNNWIKSGYKQKESLSFFIKRWEQEVPNQKKTRIWNDQNELFFDSSKKAAKYLGNIDPTFISKAIKENFKVRGYSCEYI